MKNEVLELLFNAWCNLELKLKRHPEIKKDKVPKKSLSYAPDSMVRTLGSEAFFQASFYSELEKVIETNNYDLVIGVEGKKWGEKRPDIYCWKQSNSQKPFFLIEPKVTGTDLFEGNSKGEGLFLEDIKKYLRLDMLNESNTVLFFGCYYESLPKEVIEKIEDFGSLSKWLISKKGLKLPTNFLNSLVEGYAFRGNEKWLYIKN